MHPANETPPVDLELGLAGSPRPDATCLLAERDPAAAQPGEPVAKERELDLRLALGAARVLREDVEDHRGAVDRGAAEQLLEVPLLGGGERAVEHHGVGVDGEAQLVQLGHLALAEERRGVRRVLALHEPGGDVSARGVDEQGELVEPGLDLVGVVAVEHDADEHDALAESCAR